MNLRVFYSWTKKRIDPKYNKDFLYECIQIACNNIQNNDELEGVFFYVDKDTKDESGAVNIPETIEDKISNCDIFIGDLTCHHLIPLKLRTLLRKFNYKFNAEPASNVTYERGLANSNNSKKCIIDIINVAYGDKSEINFDIQADDRGFVRPIEYNLNKNNYSEVNNIKNELIHKLEESIRACANTSLKFFYDKYKPLQTWYKQKERTHFYSNNFLDEKIEALRKATTDIRIKGLSGLGKTELVHYAFSENTRQKNLYRYCDLGLVDEKDVFSIICETIRNKENFIFVLDNCELSFFSKLIEYKHQKNLDVQFISITNDYFEKTGTGFTELNIIDKETISIIDDLIANSNISPQYESLIKNASQGNTQMALYYINEIKRSKIPSGSINDSYFMDKILKADSHSDDREVLRVFALFRYVGIESPRDEEYKFLAQNPEFATLSISDKTSRCNFFYKVYSEKKVLFDRRGNLVGIRLLPVSLFLLSEWFDSCSSDRIDNILRIMESDAVGKGLINSFSERIKYLQGNENAEKLMAHIVRPAGPFGNAEVLSSEIESRLFRSFAEVAPEAVADNLYRNITELPFDDIKNKIEGRRNTVWALQTLCFDKRSFEKAAKTLLHISVAENETYGNNATNVFTHLFSIYIPGTETSLEERFILLSWAIQNKAYKPLVIKSLYNVFEFEHTVYLGGAEKQGTKALKHYEPTEDEKVEYFTNCFNLLKNEIISATEFKEECKNILCNSLRCLCRFGYIDFILPRIIELVEAGNNDWDNLVQSINSVKAYDLRFVKPESRHLLDDCLSLIKKEDFASRFILASELESYGEHDFKTLKKLQETNYKELAEEFSLIENLDVDTLRVMYSKDFYDARPFGLRLAELWNNNDKKSKDFISKTLNILINMKEVNLTFFTSFLEKTNKVNYDYCINLLKTNEITNSLIFKLGSIRNTAFKEFSFIFDIIQKNNQLSTFLYDFSQWHNWEETSDIDVKEFFANSIKFLSMRNDIIYNIAFRVFAFEKIEKYNYTFNYICDYTRKNYKTFDISGKNTFYEFAETIFRDNKSTELAELVNEILLYSLSNSTGYEGNGHYETLFTILMKNYFDYVFPKISEEFLNQKNPFEHFNLVNIFRSVHGSHNENKDILFFAEHKEKYLQWCDENLYASVFLAEVIPVYGENDVSPEAKLLIERYYNRSNLLRNISINMENIMCWGSIVPVLKHKKRIYEHFENSKIKEIREWAKTGINNVNDEIQQQQNFEDEEDFINGI